MHLTDQAAGDRQALLQPAQPVMEGGDVARDLDHVVERHPRRLVDLEQQEIREGGLRAFDLRGENGFLADVRVQEVGPVREQGRDAVEATEGEERRLEARLEVPVEVEGRDRRQGSRGERLDPLASYRGGFRVVRNLE